MLKMSPELKIVDEVSVKDRIYGYAKKVLDYSITKQENFAGNNPTLAWLYQYVLLNIILARPSFSVVCTWERKKQLEDMGVNEPGMISLIALQAVADHIAPNFVIAGILMGMNQMTDIPATIALPTSWILGRIAWGTMCGVVHASAYAATRNLNISDEASSESSQIMPCYDDVFSEINQKFSQARF